MRTEDLIVEVRDKTLARLGKIQPKFLVGSIIPRDSAVGEWRLRLPMEHPMAAHLRTPGAGIIVSLYGEPVFSGPMTKATTDVTFEDEVGILTVEGVSDEIVLWDTLAWPDPDFDFSLGDYTMDFAYDEFTGLPWDAMEYYLGNLDRFDVGSLASFVTFDGSAVDGSGVNLIPNPEPTTLTGWSTSPAGQNEHVDDYITTASLSSYYIACNQLSQKIYPVASGTSAVAVTAGTSYTVTVSCLHFGGNATDLTVGVDWFDESGDALSTSTGTTVAATSISGTSEVWIYDGDTAVDYGYEGQPSESIEAPVGAAYGRPWVEYEWATSNPAQYRQTYTADFSMMF